MKRLVLVLVLLAGLVAGGWFVHHRYGIPLLDDRIKVSVQLPASGDLIAGSPVTWKGIAVGRVMQVDAAPSGVVAVVRFDSKYSTTVPSDCTFKVEKEGLVDRRAELQLHVLDPSSPALEDGAVVRGVGSSLELTILKGKRQVEKVIDLATDDD